MQFWIATKCCKSSSMIFFRQPDQNTIIKFSGLLPWVLVTYYWGAMVIKTWYARFEPQKYLFYCSCDVLRGVGLFLYPLVISLWMAVGLLDIGCCKWLLLLWNLYILHLLQISYRQINMQLDFFRKVFFTGTRNNPGKYFFYATFRKHA